MPKLSVKKAKENLIRRNKKLVSHPDKELFKAANRYISHLEKTYGDHIGFHQYAEVIKKAYIAGARNIKSKNKFK